MMERMAKKEEMIEEIDGNENRKLYLPEKVTQEISETALNLNALRKERKKNPNYFSEYPSIEVILLSNLFIIKKLNLVDFKFSN